MSAEHGLSLSRQAGATSYLETSALQPHSRYWQHLQLEAIPCSRSTLAAFEVAFLASLGELAARKPRLATRRELSEPRSSIHRGSRLNCLASQGQEPYILGHSRSGSMSSVSLTSKTSTLSSTTSDTVEPTSPTVAANLASPVLRVTTGRTPSVTRKAAKKTLAAKQEEMVTIKCQRLTADRQYEEIEIEVPAEVYSNIQTVRGEE